jgi:hypothetical protein
MKARQETYIQKGLFGLRNTKDMNVNGVRNNEFDDTFYNTFSL